MVEDIKTKDSKVLDQLGKGFVLNERYEIMRKLGAGGFAVVFLGRDLQIERDVAIKVMSTSETVTDPEVREQLLKRFRREASLAGRIDHPNVLNIYDYGVIDGEGEPFIVMEHLQGHDLESQFYKQGAMDPAHIVPLFIDTLVALGVAHERGIVHKDLKPSNLFLKRPGTRMESLCILDFGIAHIQREMRSRLTQAGQLMGTPAYLPPEYSTEQIVTPMLDVYQMGLILIESMTGEAVVQHSEPMAAMFQHVRGKLEVPKKLMESPLGPVLERALALEHEVRFENGLEFADALEAIAVEAIPKLEEDFELVVLDQGASAPGTTGAGDDVSRQASAVDGQEEESGGAVTRLSHGGTQSQESVKDSAMLVDEPGDETPATGSQQAIDASGPQPLPAVQARKASLEPRPAVDATAEREVRVVEQRRGEVDETGSVARPDVGEIEWEEPGTKKGMLLIAIVAIAGMLVGGGLWATGVFDGEVVEEESDGESESDTDDSGAVATDEDEDEDVSVDEPEEPEAVVVALTTEPEGASVVDKEDELGETPLELELEEEESRQLLLVLEDHEDKSVTIAADDEPQSSFELSEASKSQDHAGVGSPPTGSTGASPGTGGAGETDDDPPASGQDDDEDAEVEPDPSTPSTPPEEDGPEEDEPEEDEPEEDGPEEDESEEEEDSDSDEDDDDDSGGGIRLPDY